MFLDISKKYFIEGYSIFCYLFYRKMKYLKKYIIQIIKELENILKTCHIEEINFINSKLKKDSNSIVYYYFEPLEI